MNDFTNLENELKKLRPLAPTHELIVRIEQEFADLENQAAEKKIVRPARFNSHHWISIGLGLAAAAAFLIFALIKIDISPTGRQVAQKSPAPETRSTIASPGFIPSGATQVVYRTRDEGLHFPNGADEPVRRVRYQKQHTIQWRDPKTGASLRVTYPTEEVVLTPVTGQ
jgi:hypothetical protein